MKTERDKVQRFDQNFKNQDGDALQHGQPRPFTGQNRYVTTRREMYLQPNYYRRR